MILCLVSDLLICVLELAPNLIFPQTISSLANLVLSELHVHPKFMGVAITGMTGVLIL